MFQQRKELYRQLEDIREASILSYVTGDRSELETKIASEVLDFFIHHLDAIGDVEKISLFLYTRGGDTLASWSISNLIRQFCNKLEVIIPYKCHSGGTLICLGADNIIMTKQATLGPIDPSINTPLNPQIPGAPPTIRYPVSVEAMGGFLDFVKSEGVKGQELNEILLHLAKEVHPLVLGQAFRSRTQIRMLAKKLLSRQKEDKVKIEKILDFLCSESGSHDYTINRKEARDELELVIEKPNDNLYSVIKSIYDDIALDLELNTPYDPNIILGSNNNSNYCFRRALIESLQGGSHSFISEGQLSRQQIEVQPGNIQIVIKDNRIFEGWRHENA